MTRGKHLIIGLITLAAIALAMVVAGAVLAWETRQDLFRFGQVVHRQLSQRVEQHDAHLTSLSALAQAANPVPEEAIRQVAASIRQFYPRITAIDVMAFTPGEARAVLGDIPGADVMAAARAAGAAAQLTHRSGGPLLLAKRAGADEARYHAIVLTLDPARLMALDQSLPAGAGLILSLAETPLARQGDVSATARPVFRQALASRTQPLQLTLAADLGRWTAPAPGVIALIIGLGLAGGLLADRLAEASARAREASRASARATLDARLAHAGRVNAMGEMASGIAHELTQPLTAMLSQAQAGHRLAQRPEPDLALITSAFEAIARNAKRAGEILGKLRSWISQGETRAEPVVLADVAQDVAGLIKLNGLPPGITIRVEAPAAGPVVLADRTQIEQVVFNLMRNAIEAVTPCEGPQIVRLTLAEDGAFGVVLVEDSGPGLSPEAQQKLFEPFFTTKPDGMGLGLALCLTLVERFGGSLTAGTSPLGGAAFTARLPLASPDRERLAA